MHRLKNCTPGDQEHYGDECVNDALDTAPVLDRLVLAKAEPSLDLLATIVLLVLDRIELKDRQ